MKRTLILGIGCLCGAITSRFLNLGGRNDDGAAIVAAPVTNIASIAAATGIAGRVSDSLNTDPDDYLVTFGIGFATGAVLTVFAAPISRAMGSMPGGR